MSAVIPLQCRPALFSARTIGETRLRVLVIAGSFLNFKTSHWQSSLVIPFFFPATPQRQQLVGDNLCDPTRAASATLTRTIVRARTRPTVH